MLSCSLCDSYWKESTAPELLDLRPDALSAQQPQNPRKSPGVQPSSYHRSSATSTAIPGPSAIITPQSPGSGSPLRTISSKTNMTVGEDIFP
jgi:hypothetical protein